VTCAACIRAATYAHSGLYHAGCRGCEVRALATSPRHIRDARYEQELTRNGMAPLAVLKSEVKREFERIQALKRS
jgi:hypothetical protein